MRAVHFFFRIVSAPEIATLHARRPAPKSKHPAIREDWPGAVKEPLERWEAYLYGDQNVFGATSDSALNVAAGTFGMESTVGITNVLPKMSVALLE